MADEPQKVEVTSAEITGQRGDTTEVELEVRISKLEAEEAEDEETTREMLLRLVHLQESSLKHSVALALGLAVLFFIASKALGA